MSTLSDKEFNKLLKELKNFYGDVGFENDRHYILGQLRKFYFQLYLDVMELNTKRDNGEFDGENPF